MVCVHRALYTKTDSKPARNGCVVTAVPFSLQSSEQSKTLKLPFPTDILEVILDFLYSGQARKVQGNGTYGERLFNVRKRYPAIHLETRAETLLSSSYVAC